MIGKEQDKSYSSQIARGQEACDYDCWLRLRKQIEEKYSNEWCEPRKVGERKAQTKVHETSTTTHCDGWSGWQGEISRWPPTHTPKTETPPTQKETYQNPSYDSSLSLSICLSLSLSCPSPKPAVNLPPSRSREETGGADGRQEKCLPRQWGLIRE